MELSPADITRGLVSPREMARMVHTLLRKNSTLQLVKAENLVAEAIPLADTAKPATTGAPAGPTVYRHGLRLQVKGRYADIVRYLHTLERLDWRVIWGSVRPATGAHSAENPASSIIILSL